MDFLWSKKSEGNVGVQSSAQFRDEICKLDPAEQAKMIQNMQGSNKDAAVKVDADGSINFPGQFVVGSVHGRAEDNQFNLGPPEPGKTISIHDSHNNQTVVFCGHKEAIAKPNATTSEVTDGVGTASRNDQRSVDDIVNEALRKAGIDPTPNASAPMKQDRAKVNAGSRMDIELPNRSHVLIDQEGDGPPKVSAPENVSVKEARDGGLNIKFGGVTLHEKDGGLTSDHQGIDGVNITMGPIPSAKKAQ